MKALAGGLVVGVVVSRLLWRALAALFESPALTRTNYRGATLPTAAGVVLALAVLLVEAGRAVAAAFGVGDVGLTGPRVLVLTTVLGYGVLGLVDDVLGSATHKGFRGHGSALLSGQVTSGLLKLAGGGAVALVVVAPAVGRSPGRLVADALVVALAANMANLLDRAPGRTTKAAAAAFALLVLGVGAAPELVAVAVVVGAALGLLLDDLQERLMLGDAGANPLGAVLGLATVMATGPRVRDVVLVALVTLNVAGELVSFSRVIDLVPPCGPSTGPVAGAEAGPTWWRSPGSTAVPPGSRSQPRRRRCRPPPPCRCRRCSWSPCRCRRSW